MSKKKRTDNSKRLEERKKIKDTLESVRGAVYTVEALAAAYKHPVTPAKWAQLTPEERYCLEKKAESIVVNVIKLLASPHELFPILVPVREQKGLKRGKIIGAAYFPIGDNAYLVDLEYTYWL